MPTSTSHLGPVDFDHIVDRAIFSNFRIAGKRVRSDEELPTDFAPSSEDVICARGRQAFNHAGNTRFRNTVFLHMEEYEAAKSKPEKSVIVSKIVEIVRDSSGGRFARFNKQANRWISLGDIGAREKVGQAIRDAKVKKRSKCRRQGKPISTTMPEMSLHQVERKKEGTNTLRDEQGPSSLVSQIAHSFQHDKFHESMVEPVAPIIVEDGDAEHLLEGITFKASDFFRMSVSSGNDFWQHAPALSAAILNDDGEKDASH